MMARVRWILVVSALLLVPAMQGCGDGDRLPKTDAGAQGDGGGGTDMGGVVAGQAGAQVSPTSGLRTTERGGQSTFTVVLTARPSARVVIGLSSSDDGEGTVAPAQLIFTPQSWNSRQMATVTGVDDDVHDGSQEYTIRTAPIESDDENYHGLDLADVTVANADNETPGITIAAADGLETSEDKYSAEFSVVLNSEPTADVLIALRSDNPEEGTVAPDSLTFTPENWAAPQAVAVTGADDDVIDGPKPYKIVTAPAVSADENYNELDADDVVVTNLDNDTAGFRIMPSSGLVTDERGRQATFVVRLETKPSAPVTLALSTADGDEISFAPSTLTFSAEDWEGLHTVIVTGRGDDAVDGDQTWEIVSAPAESDDPRYHGFNPPNVSGRNHDADTARVSVNRPEAELRTREDGGQAQFSFNLTARPTSNVTVTLATADGDEVSMTPATLVFTTEDWEARKSVQLEGVDDPDADGNQTFTITVAVESDDAAYAASVVENITGTNVDDELPGISVEGASALETRESGQQDSFTVRLDSRPTADVVIGLSSSDPGEVTVGVSSLTFTRDNWHAPQTVLLTGIDDRAADGHQQAVIQFRAAASDDATYAGRRLADVTVVNRDDDVPDVLVELPQAGLVTTEGGGQASFTVALATQPSANVSIALTSSDAGEAILSASVLTFTADNWAAPQTVTLTGREDSVDDGQQPFDVIFGPVDSADKNYDDFPIETVSGQNTDNDSAGINVAPHTTLVVAENGEQGSFSVSLNSRPTASVTIPIASSDIGEASVSPASLTFTTDNWAAPQTVLVTGRSDLSQDGHQPFAVRIGPGVSTDANYAGRTVADLAGTNLDIDSPDIRVIVDDAGLFTDEGGGQTRFRIMLLKRPAAAVTLPIGTSAPDEGTAGPASVTFTPLNWDAPQDITLTGVDDAVQDGAQPYFILVGPAVSADVAYGGRTVPNVRATNRDDDTAGVTLGDARGLSTSEAAGVTNTDTFTIVLNSQPIAPVTFHFASSDLGEGTVSPASVTFTAGNWASPVTITLTGEQDEIDDGSVVYQVQIGAPTTTDVNYAAQFVPNVPVTNTDDDTAGVTVTADTLTTSEAGGTASFTVVLHSEPTVDVVIPVVSGALGEGTVVAPASGDLRFTRLNWNVAQTVTLRGVDDSVQDGDRVYAIRLGPIQGGDAAYAAIALADLSATNLDDDIAGIVVAPRGPLATSETGLTASFTVVLRSQPTGAVAIALSSDDVGEVRVSPGVLNFTPDNWDAAQTVTLTGQDDFVADRAQPFAIAIGPAVSPADGDYDGMRVPDVLGTNTDNDSPGYRLSKTSVTTFEFGVADTFTVRLNSQPTAPVEFSVASTVPGEALVAPPRLTFTDANWDVAQTVTVTGQDDGVFDGDQPYVIELGAGVSADTDYDGLDAPDVAGTNVEAGLSCNEWHSEHPALPSGVFPLDTDRAGPNPRFEAWCDMSTDGGGFTLLSWSGDTSDGVQGVPYPGLDPCPAFNCARGTGVPSGSLNALFDNSTQFAQGQSTTTGFQPTFDDLGSYEFAGVYNYGAPLTNLTVDGAFSGCTGVATGSYEDLAGTADSDGEVVYLNSGLHRDGEAAFGDFRSDASAYTWSIGARGGYCDLNSAVPSSYLGTWHAGQYGPGVPAAAGSYSVWIR